MGEVRSHRGRGLITLVLSSGLTTSIPHEAVRFTLPFFLVQNSNTLASPNESNRTPLKPERLTKLAKKKVSLKPQNMRLNRVYLSLQVALVVVTEESRAIAKQRHSGRRVCRLNRIIYLPLAL